MAENKKQTSLPFPSPDDLSQPPEFKNLGWAKCGSCGVCLPPEDTKTETCPVCSDPIWPDNQ